MRIRSCVLLGVVLGWAHSLPGDVLYSVTDLGALGMFGNGINDHGQVIGLGISGHAVLYSNGQTMDLGGLGGSSEGYGINNAGQATGWANTSTGFGHAFLYNNGQMMDLGTLGGPVSVGYGVNNNGQVTGYSYVSTSTNGLHAFLYSNGQMMDLGTLGGLDYSIGRGINDRGQVTGVSYTASGAEHAFLYSNGTILDLGTLEGFTDSQGYGINNAGQITGGADTVTAFMQRGVEHTFLYSNGTMLDLGTLEGFPDSQGYGINNAGQVVGCVSVYYPAGGCARAFLYSDGRMMDLNSLIDPALGITLSRATAINDSGQIVADGYLLTPVPEPRTWILLGVAMLAASMCIRRHRGPVVQMAERFACPHPHSRQLA